MWRLFKEVFKSFSKNKVVVAGLSILVFLASLVFTLLSSIRSSIKNSFNDYKNVSKLHDASVDLNLPSQGSANNQGFFINNKSDDDLKNISPAEKKEAEELTKYGISFEDAFYKKEYSLNNKDDIKEDLKNSYFYKRNILNIGNLDEYISFADIGVTDPNFSNKFFLKKDLVNFYLTYRSKNNNDFVSFELDKEKAAAPYFSFKNNKAAISVYESDHSFSTKQFTFVKSTDKAKFLKNHTIGDLMNLKIVEENNKKTIYASQLASFFINAETKEITTNFVLGQQWIDQGVGKALNIEKIIQAFGFKKSTNSNFEYEQEYKQINLSKYLKQKSNVYISENLEIENEWSLDELLEEDFVAHKKEEFKFEENKQYKIPFEWVAQEESSTAFWRFNYQLSYKTDASGEPTWEKWDGSYKKFAESIYKNRDSETRNLWEKLNSFSYWRRLKTISIIPYKKSSSWELNEENKIESKQFYDLNKIDDFYESENIKLKDKDGTVGTVRELEKKSASERFDSSRYYEEDNISKDDLLNEINNKNLKNERFNLIKDNALQITKRNLYEEIKKIVHGEQNIGIRETLTVDAINEKNNQKNVFHFINSGNQNNEIDGIKINVGKLYNEHYDPSQLNNFTVGSSDVFSSLQLPPKIAHLIFQSLSKNFYIDPSYIDPIYSYEPVIDTDSEGNITKLLNKKTIELNDYKNISNNPDDYKNKTNGYGITFYNNGYKIVKKENGVWKTISNEFSSSALLNWLEKNNYTIAVSYLRSFDGDGKLWAKNDASFQNSYYIPLLYLSPKSQIVFEILKTGKVDSLVEGIERALLNWDLVNKKYITIEQIRKLTEATKKVLNKHNFGTVFAAGKINQGLIPQIIFDLLYEISKNSNEDLLASILQNVFVQIKNELTSKGSVEEQKKYLTQELNNIFTLFKNLMGVDIFKYISPESLANSSKDPLKFLDGFSELISSISFRNFADQANKWFENQNNKSDPVKTEYIKKLSSGQIINWLISSIDQRELKQSLFKIIDNLDIEKIVDLNNSNSILHKLLSLINPSLVEGVKPILSKINATPSDPFSNVKQGLKEIISLVNFDILKDELLKRTKKTYLDYEVKSFNASTNKYETKIFKVVLESIKPVDGFSAFINSIFKTKGANRSFKESLTKMFNLASLDGVQEIDIDGQKIYLPKKSTDKLDFFDFLDIFKTSLSSKNNANLKNYYWELQAKKIIDKLEKSNLQTFNLSTLNNDEKDFLKKYEISKTTDVNRKEFLVKLKNILRFINQTKGGINSFIPDSQKTGADLLNDLLNFNGSSNSTWSLLKNVISSSASLDISNEYALGQQAFSTFASWINLANDPSFTNKNIWESFLEDFLEFALEPETLKITQKKASSENIPFSKLTNYYLTEQLLFNNPQAIFDNSNPAFNRFLAKNPKYKTIIQNNKEALSKQLAYIGASKLFSSNDNDAKNGIYYQTIKKFVDNYLKGDNFLSIKSIASKMIQELSLKFPVELLGISEAMVNPILRVIFPEVTISHLVYESSTPISRGNLEYLLFEKIINFETLAKESDNEESAFYKHLQNSLSNQNSSYLKPLNLDRTELLSLDEPFLRKFKNNKDKIFDINFVNFIYQIIGEITEPKEIKEIVFNDPWSYVAKVNYAYLRNNNKSIYTGKLPKNPFDMLHLLNTLDEKYILDVNGTKYIIIGQETTVDYMYPVVDENNLQVNTKSQALVYVNELGFARIRSGYQGNVVKKALLIKNASGESDEKLKQKLTELVNKSINDPNKLQRVFLTKEVDPINPERALRISTIDGIINVISTTSIGIISIFTLLVAISVVFVIQRYVANKNKVIGILVAQGYKPWQISISFIAFAIVVSLIGGVLGYAIGNKLQYVVLGVFSSYWTLPRETISFDFVSLFFTVFLPLIGMSILIFIVSMLSLRHKALDLISGSNEVPETKLFKQFLHQTRKVNVKRRFSLILGFKSFWKLISFSLSVTLAGISTLFGIANINVFSNAINKTYENRKYTFKTDLESQTVEGGLYTPFDISNLNNNLYTPLGQSIESNKEIYDYFKPGYSSVVNRDNKNGTPGEFDSHILSQFSTNLAVDAGVSANPWQVMYNSMPDTQKSRIDKIRDKIGYQLEASQNGDFAKLIRNQNGSISYENGTNKYSFFKYYKSPYDKQGYFVYAYWNDKEKEYQMQSISTTNKRDEYRKFLVDGYSKINKEVLASQNQENDQNTSEIEENKNNYWLWSPDYKQLGKAINDYYISFGGALVEKENDLTYTYLQTMFKGQTFKIYGYNIKDKTKLDKFVKFKDSYNNDLVETLRKYTITNNVYPVIVNEVTAKKYNLTKGAEFTVEIKNKVNRYWENWIEKFGNETSKAKLDKKAKFVTFKVIGINKTYISNELFTTQEIANKLIGASDLDNLVTDKNKIKDKGQLESFFNGVMTVNKSPKLLTESTSVYSPSGYWAALDTWSLGTYDTQTKEQIFSQLFNRENGVLTRIFAKDEIMNFLLNRKADNLWTGSDSDFDAEFNSLKKSPDEYIKKFANMYNDKFYLALGASIESKDIEVGFTNQIASTVETVSTSIIALTFAISLIILVIMSTILINENQKNIAIWSILGYTSKEKIRMFFGLFMPFILLALLVSVPISLLMINTFNSFLLNSSSILLPLVLSPLHVLIATVVIFGVFISTSFIIWASINKMKPIELLKGR